MRRSGGPDSTMGWFDEPSELQAEIVERLGVSWHSTCRGDNGRVFLLDDGRVLKITGEREAALCVAMMECGRTHPCVPVVHEVLRHESMIDCTTVGCGWLPLSTFAILREDFADVPDHMMHAVDGGFDAWWRGLDAIQSRQSARIAEHADCLEQGRPPPRARRPETCDGSMLDMVRSGLDWIERVAGVVVGDVRMPNVGVSASGGVGMRDLGGGEPTQAMLDRVRRPDFPAVPDAAPSPRGP